jgi:SET domain-containing protein
MSSVRRPQPYYRVRRSPIHGTGVFAARRIPKGTRVIEYLGERVSHAEADRRYEDKDISDNHTFLFTVDARTVIDAGVGGNAARYINHSCDPNCESVIEKGRVYIDAVRDIAAGAELAYDYMIEREPGDPPDIDAIFGCRCGAAQCRGTMLLPARPAARRQSGRKSARKAPRKSDPGKSSTRKSSAGKTARPKRRRKARGG